MHIHSVELLNQIQKGKRLKQNKVVKFSVKYFSIPFIFVIISLFFLFHLLQCILLTNWTTVFVFEPFHDALLMVKMFASQFDC